LNKAVVDIFDSQLIKRMEDLNELSLSSFECLVGAIRIFDKEAVDFLAGEKG
jgi:hypothetical protein